MMDDPNSPILPERHEEPARPLEYRSAAADRRENPPAGPFVLGALMSLIAGPAAVALGILANLHQESDAPFWGIVGITVGSLILIAVMTYRSGSARQRGLATGIWVGLGLAVLIEGVCFLSLSK